MSIRVRGHRNPSDYDFHIDFPVASYDFIWGFLEMACAAHAGCDLGYTPEDETDCKKGTDRIIKRDQKGTKMHKVYAF